MKPDEAVGQSKLVAGDSPSDDECVGRARGGDAGAFRILVERYRGRVHGLALRIVHSAPDAEEVAQDAFVRAWLALPRFRGDSSFSTWIYRIAARRAFDRARALKLKRGREAGLEAAGDPAAPAEGGAASGPARDLERLVAALPPAQRAVVTLYYLEDQSVERVAEALGMPENTVKTHLSRARAALRAAWLAREGETP